MDDDSISAMCAAHGPVAPACRFPGGTIFGDWRVTAFIGRGGNGEVYCAEHAALGTPAALKVLIRDEHHAKERFTREAKLLSELKSTSFPQFYSYGEANGCPYLAMELLEPGELPAGDRNIARFLLSVCDAVVELHSRGYIHRDIKPSNILWRTGTTGGSTVAVPVVTDLGLAKTFGESRRTLTGGSGVPPLHENQAETRYGVGTPGYGAPEQIERGEATVASDIHALGVLADACFGGKPPRTWARIIRRATSSIPAHRYPSVAAFARAIRWRHLWRNAAWLTVALLVLAAMAKLNSGKSHVDDASGARGSMMGNITPEVLEGVMRTGRIPSQKATAEPSIMPNVVRLNGEKVALTEPLVLEGGKEYLVFGPGTLDADLFCPTTAIVRLKGCALINRTTRLYPENGIRYRLDDGVYLNFINVKHKPLSLTERDFVDSYDGAYNHVRFGGPETVKELMEQINEERSIEIQSMEP